VARQGRNGGGLGSFSAHVTDDERPGVLGQGQDVVEVAADLTGRGREVQRRQLSVGDRRQLRRKQALLQRACHVLGLLAQGLLGLHDASAGQSQLELVHDDARHVAQRAHVLLIENARLAIDHAQCSEIEAVLGGERDAGIEPQSQLSGHERVGQRARIDRRVLDHPRAVVQDGRGAQPGITAHFPHLHAMMRLEPDPIVVDDAHDRDRHPEMSRGQRGDAVERTVLGRVEHLVAPHRRQARGFLARTGSVAGCHVGARIARSPASFTQRKRRSTAHTLDRRGSPRIREILSDKV